MADKKIYSFTNEIEAVEVCALGAQIELIVYDGESITAEYDNPADKPEFCAVLCGKRLTLKETATFSIFREKPEGEYKITVKLPRKKFYEVKLKTTSGEVTTPAELEAENFTLVTASGSSEVDGKFDNIKIKSASGSVKLIGGMENTAKKLSITSVSGSVTTDRSADEFSLSNVSGHTEYTNAKGTGNVAVTSGSVDISYAQWTDDLKISAVSGKVNAYLPENSGADIEFDAVSGRVKTNLGSNSGDVLNLGKGTHGQFGGSNVHKVNVSLVSGTVSVLQAEKTVPNDNLVDEK